MSEERRTSDTLVLELLHRAIAQNDLIIGRLDESDRKLDAHMHEEERVIKSLMAAFPKKPSGAPDFEGHEVYHTSLIEESRAKANFYRELQHELIKKGLWGLLAILLALIVFWWNGHVPPPKP